MPQAPMNDCKPLLMTEHAQQNRQVSMNNRQVRSSESGKHMAIGVQCPIQKVTPFQNFSAKKQSGLKRSSTLSTFLSHREELFTCGLLSIQCN